MTPTGTSKTDTRHGSPVLGYARYIEFGKHSGQARTYVGDGWGDFMPSTLDFTGDGTTSFANVHWTGWGGSITYGRGAVLVFRPEGGHVAVRGDLRATQLGTCHGRRAYEHLEYRLRLKAGTRLYRFIGRAANRWRPYGWGTTGDICRVAKTLF